MACTDRDASPCRTPRVRRGTGCAKASKGLSDMGQSKAQTTTPDEISHGATSPALDMANLVQLEARLHVHRSDQRDWRYHAAGRALSRLREAGVDIDLSLPISTLRDRHARIVTALNPVPRDEISCLSSLFDLPPVDVEVAERIRSGNGTLADAVAAVAARRDLSDPTRIIGAVKSLAMVISQRDGTPIHAVPARLKHIDGYLSTLTHVDFGVAKSSFDSKKARIRTAIRLVDMSVGRRLPTSQLLPAWQTLISVIEATALARGDKKRGGLMGDRAKLSRLIAYCHERQIAPAAVTDVTIAAFRDALAADGTAGAFALVRDTVYAWERLQKDVDAFPRQTLQRLYSGRGKCLARGIFETLPLPFQSDWAAFEQRFGRESVTSQRATLAALVVGHDVGESEDDPFADEDDDSWADDEDLPELAGIPGPQACLSPAYLKQLKSLVLHAALVVQDSGQPLHELQDILAPRQAERLLRHKLQKQRRVDAKAPQKNNTLRNLATGLISIARLIGTPSAAIEELLALRDKVDPFLLKVTRRADGSLQRHYMDERMGPRHKQRLAAMAQDDALLAWFEMVPTLRRKLDRVIRDRRTPTPKECNDAVVMVLHAITRCCPLRRAGLARIPVYGPDAWLKMPTSAGGSARLTIPREFVKNRTEITVELTPAAVDAIKFYLDHVRPVIAERVGADLRNPHLFPAKGMGHRAAESLNSQFVARNRKLGGFSLNLHCQRHLAGKIILDRDHGQMETVRQLLGHKSLKTTERYYTEVNQIFAQRAYHGHLEAHYAELLARRARAAHRRSA
jgi:hypothetical protein